MFVDGVAFEGVLETSEEFFWVTSRVRITGDHITLDDLTIYPATSARQEVGTRALLELLRILKTAAREQGLLSYTLHADRAYGDGRERIIDMTGRLR